jgi:dTDP-4-dehydrorhamnose reductase
MSKKKVYLTGLTGTVAPFLIKALHAKGFEVVGKHIRIEHDQDVTLSLADIALHRPQQIFHLALGPIMWAEALARYAFVNRLTFIYLSTASVFDDNAAGPYTIDTEVKAKAGYPLYKFQCEQAVKQVNPLAYILRIGWQIDPEQKTNTNNMFRFFKEQLDRQGKIVVSDTFFPSSSWLPDTANAIMASLDHPSGLFHLNGNHHSLFAIAHYLKQRFNYDWVIEKDSHFSRNDVLLDQRIKVPPIIR